MMMKVSRRHDSDGKGKYFLYSEEEDIFTPIKTLTEEQEAYLERYERLSHLATEKQRSCNTETWLKWKRERGEMDVDYANMTVKGNFTGNLKEGQQKAKARREELGITKARSKKQTFNERRAELLNERVERERV